MAAFLVYGISKKRKFNFEVLDAYSKCLEINKKLQRGYAKFIPPEGEEELYVEMVSRGLMMETPLGGYMMRGKGNELWGGIPAGSVSVSESSYEDDDGVLAADKVDGKWVSKIIEKDNKPVLVNQEEK